MTTEDKLFYRGPGIRSDSAPATLSSVTVNVNDQAAGDNRAVALHAGLVGVAQHEDGALQPVAGWYLAPATIQIDDVIDQIIRDHDADPPQPDRPLFEIADLVAVYRRVGAATLFDGEWRLRPAAEHREVWRGEDQCPLLGIIDLPDGRSIAAAIDFTTQTGHWILCRIEKVAAEPLNEHNHEFRLADQPADVPVYGTSLALLLHAALDSGGDISHLETGRLDQLDRPTG